MFHCYCYHVCFYMSPIHVIVFFTFHQRVNARNTLQGDGGNG